MHEASGWLAGEVGVMAGAEFMLGSCASVELADGGVGWEFAAISVVGVSGVR